MSKNIAIILAGGSGTRVGGNIPKQFLKIDGKTIMEYAIEAFESHENINEIAIVVRPDFLNDVREIVSRRKFIKVCKILPGGKERYLSTLAAIEAYSDDDDKLIFHDAVRPLVSHRIIDDCLKALEKYNAVDTAFNTTDTIVEVDENNCIHRIPDRAFLRNGQTPQCFCRGTIRRAYEIALRDPGFRTTDDCGVVVRYLPDEPVYVVAGDVTNMKVTFKEDLQQIQMLMGKKAISPR